MHVAVGNVRLGDELLASAAHAYHALNSVLHYLEDENYVEEEAAHGVRDCVYSFLCDLLGVLFDILDASKAAVVIVVVPMQRPSISAKRKRESLRILPEHFWAHSGSLRRDRVLEFTSIGDLPG